jgi:hypothetical protein
LRIGFNKKNIPMHKSRRDFIKKTSAGAVAFSFGGVLPAFSAGSYRNIMGANEKIRVACMGVNSRGLAVGKNLASQKDCEVLHVSDVDTRAAETCISAIEKIQQKKTKGNTRF